MRTRDAALGDFDAGGIECIASRADEWFGGSSVHRRLLLSRRLLVKSEQSRPRRSATPTVLTVRSRAAIGGSTACQFQLFVPMRGILATWHNRALNMTTPLLAVGYHINHSIWGRGDGCGLNEPRDMLETGLTRGYHGSTGYGYYVAWRQDGSYADAWDGAASVDGSAHTYAIESTGSGGVFRATRDGSLRIAAANIGDFICVGQTGLEISFYNYYGPTNETSSQTFDAKPLKWQDVSLNWHNGWTPPGTQYWIDYPCGSPPTCLNGVRYAADHWASNKP